MVYVLNRGGRFASADPAKGDGYDGDLIKTKYAGLCAFYDPKTASLKDALTGENFDGLAHTAPIAFADGTAMARPADDRSRSSTGKRARTARTAPSPRHGCARRPPRTSYGCRRPTLPSAA